MKRRRYRVLVALLVLATALTGLFLVGMDGVADTWALALLQVKAVQRDLHHDLSAAMRTVQAEGLAASWALVSLSFLYGVFHAIGPGHGKIVISTYLLTQESQLRRGIVLSFVASLCQGITAVLVVAATIGVLDLSLRQAQGAAADLETLSYGLLGLVGIVLVASRTRRLARGHRPREPSYETTVTVADEHRHHRDRHEAFESCGHVHGPGLEDLDKPLSWRGLAGMVASIGLRPCSGAVLAMLVAYSLNIRLAGVVAVLATSIGTALTVSSLAVLSVYARRQSLRLATLLPDASSRIAVIADVVGMVGGGVIFLVGALLLHAAWGASTHPFL